MQKKAGQHFSRPKNRAGIHFCHRKLPQIREYRSQTANSQIMHALILSQSRREFSTDACMHACMICRSEFSPKGLKQRMHGHRPARIRSGGCMSGNRKIMPKKCCRSTIYRAPQPFLVHACLRISVGPEFRTQKAAGPALESY
eukprot:COSAG05_NODE_4389_length_1534_cov_8.898258_1_plen_143_part_00